MPLVYAVKETYGGSIRAIIERLVREEYCLHVGAKVVILFEIWDLRFEICDEKLIIDVKYYPLSIKNSIFNCQFSIKITTFAAAKVNFAGLVAQLVRATDS